MKQFIITSVAALLFSNCHAQKNSIMENNDRNDLPTIGIIIFDGFLSNEVVAPLDVFTKKDTTGRQPFKVILVSKENRACTSEEGLKVLPDFTFENCPELKVLVVPSSMNPDNQVNDEALLAFVKKVNKTTDYTASHCAGAFVLGASGVADGKKVVTYCGGSEALQKSYPDLLVQDDNKVKVIQDGKIFSSNGNLVSYIGSLDLLEKMTSKAHRQHVEEELLINKLK